MPSCRSVNNRTFEVSAKFAASTSQWYLTDEDTYVRPSDE